MSVNVSTGLKTTLLESGLDAAFNNGVLEIRSGSKPASANNAPTGTLLASIALPADAFAAAAAGSKAKAGTWSDSSADNTGTAGWFRLRTASDGGGVSTTDARIDGDVTATGGGGDVTLDNTSIAAGQAVTMTSFTLGVA